MWQWIIRFAGKCWVCGASCSGTVCDACNKGPGEH